MKTQLKTTSRSRVQRRQLSTELTEKQLWDLVNISDRLTDFERRLLIRLLSERWVKDKKTPALEDLAPLTECGDKR